MVYRITKNCKTLKHFILLLSGLLIATTSIASQQSINVYLKLQPKGQITELISKFNQFLDQEQIFTTYQITPYIDAHPPHVTLYLATYDDKQIPEVMKQAELLAKKQKPLSLLTSKFVSQNDGYVMLSIVDDSQLQALSNEAMSKLAKLRDRKAPIPAWAAKDPGRKLIFNQFGSPAVLQYYKPHISIFSAENLKDDDASRLGEQLKILINQFTKKYSTGIRTRVDAIGVGITDKNGQIVKELNSFSMS